SAFVLRHREVISTSKDLAKRLADLARRIRDKAVQVLSLETEDGSFRKLYDAFRAVLIQDLTPEQFADMYAQTVTYGLLTVRAHRQPGMVVENLSKTVSIANPFLEEI